MNRINIIGWMIIAGLCSAMYFNGTAQDTQRQVALPETIQVLKAPPEPQAISQRLIVKFRERTENQAYQEVSREVGLQMISTIPDLEIVVYRITADKTIEQAMQECENYPQVLYAEPDYRVYALETPNDPDFNRLWGLHNTGQTGGTNDADIDAPEAWENQKGSKEIIVSVIDTGIDYQHPDLEENMWRNPGEIPGNGRDDDNNGFVDDIFGWDFANDDADPMDDNIHGTHVAGTIGAVGNNNRTVTGVNWQVSLMALKFLTGDGSGSTSDAIEAIVYSANNGAHIMNNSWGGGGFSQALKDAIEFALSQNSLFVAAAGNDSRNTDETPNYPSNYDVANVVSVAASNHNDDLAFFSNFGKVSVDLAAPGENILSTTPGNQTQFLSGTSMATPHVAGAAALVWAHFLPDNDDQAVKYRLFGAVDFIQDFENQMVFEGRLNLNQALSQSPLVSILEKPSDTDNTNGPYPVKASAVDNDSIVSVQLIIEKSGSETGTDTIGMQKTGDYEYEAEIPGASINTQINFKVQAKDNGQNITETRVHSFSIGDADGPPANGGCCGAMAVEISLENMNPHFNLAMNWALNFLIFFGPLALYHFKKKKSKN